MKETRKLSGALSTAILLPLVLAIAMVFIGCDFLLEDEKVPSDPTIMLKINIQDAEGLIKTTVVADNAADVPEGVKHVTNSEKNALQTVINTAITARDSGTTADKERELSKIIDAIDDFKKALKNGTGAPLDKTALIAKIAYAEDILSNTVVDDDAPNVAQGKYWVRESQEDTFAAAITAAQTVRTAGNLIQSTINTATNTLDAAISDFIDVRGTGTKTSVFDQAALNGLIADANAIKENTSVSGEGGDDISPAKFWVTQTVMDTFGSAITAAGSASDKNAAYLDLVIAINDFNDAKKQGTLPNRTPLYGAINDAKNAKTGITKASDASQVPAGSKWATQESFTALDNARNDALDLYNNFDKSKNDIETGVDTLNDAIDAFKDAIDIGTKQNSVTINGLAAYNGCSISIGLFVNNTIDINEDPAICGNGTIASGTINTDLSDTSEEGTAWAEASSWYIGIRITPNDDSYPMYFVSKATVSFTSTTDHTKQLSDFDWLVPAATALTAAEWKDSEIDGEVTEKWFSFSAASGTTYRVWLDDASGSKTLDAKISAFYSNGTSIFANVDSAWTSAAQSTIAATAAGTVYVLVTPQTAGDTGDFAIVYGTGTTRPGAPVDYTGTYSGVLSKGSLMASGATLTINSITASDFISGTSMNISNVTLGADNNITSGGTNIGTWAYVYTNSTKIGIVWAYTYSGSINEQLILGKDNVDLICSSLTSLVGGLNSVVFSDIITDYDGSLTKY